MLCWYFLAMGPRCPSWRAPLQDMTAHFAGQEVSLAVLEVTRASRKVVCSVVKAKENDDLRQLEVGRCSVAGANCNHWGIACGQNGDTRGFVRQQPPLCRLGPWSLGLCGG